MVAKGILYEIVFLLFIQKRFYTRGTLTSTRVPQLAEISTLYCDWVRAFKQEKGQLFELHRREGDGKDTQHYTQNAAINVDLF